MQHLLAIAERHALIIVFVNMLLARGGLPVPVIPTLLTVAALAGPDMLRLTEIVLAGVGGALLAELAIYWSGLRYGYRFLGLLCRVSIEPDFCVRRTEEVFARLGPWSLLFAKFLPGLSLISVAMAGVTRVPLAGFLLFDAIGATAFVGAMVALGLVFQNAIASVVTTLSNFGKFGIAAVLIAIALYVLVKWWRRRAFVRQLRMDRITVEELRQLMDGGEEVVVLDVRPKEIRAQEGVIPGALSAHPADTDAALADLSREADVIVYCACPNEESAATVARRLKRAGFKRIRPLMGGIDAWIEAGHPVERAPIVEEENDATPVAVRAEAV